MNSSAAKLSLDYGCDASVAATATSTTDPSVLTFADRESNWQTFLGQLRENPSIGRDPIHSIEEDAVPRAATSPPHVPNDSGKNTQGSCIKCGIILLALTIPAYLLVMSLSQFVPSVHRQLNWVETTGTVVDIGYKMCGMAGRKSKCDFGYVFFETPDRGNFTFQSGPPFSGNVGGTMDVLYDPSHPATAVDKSTNREDMIYGGVFSLIVLLVLIICACCCFCQC